jgi:undecaprenyl-phosphate 4-deoxy-4-formamido-L-arabinose transferase
MYARFCFPPDLFLPKKHRMRLSVIIPVYNGAKTIGPLVAEVKAALAPHYELEIVLINDGSPADNSADVCRQLAETDRSVKFLDLSRNFGEHNAVMAGLNHCTGDAAVIIDDDFQNPPSQITLLVDKLQEGFDVVFSRYDEKKHSPFRNYGSWFNNLAATVILGKPYSLYLSSFKALNRFLINEITRYDGPFPYVDGLILRVTRRYTVVTVEHQERAGGRSGYTLRKLLSLWANMFTSFSVLPLRGAMMFGFFFSIASFLLAFAFAIEKMIHPDLPLGWASVVVLLCLVAGVQLFSIGMIGEYLGRLFVSHNRRPQFVVRSAVNTKASPPRKEEQRDG